MPDTWHLTQRQIDEWAALYPQQDVLGECRKALAWVKANQHKTAKGMLKFLVRWLNNANDRPHQSRGPPNGSNRTARNQQVMEEVANE